jgi:hypothetical protein
MIELIWDAGFKRSYKKRIATDTVLKQRFWDALELFLHRTRSQKRSVRTGSPVN